MEVFFFTNLKSLAFQQSGNNAFFIVPDSPEEILKLEKELEAMYLLEGYDAQAASPTAGLENGTVAVPMGATHLL